MPSKLTIEVRAEGSGTRCRVTFKTESHSATFENLLRSPFDMDDLRDARWYFEEFPLLSGTTVAVRAAQIESRLRMKGTELYVAAFEQAAEGPRVVDLLATERVLFSLDVRIIESAGTHWIPWELMTGPALVPLSHSAASFVRTPVTSEIAGASPTTKGLRVLIVTARPFSTEETDDVPFRSVSRYILLAAAANPDAGVTVELLRPGTFEALESRLREAQATGRPYDLVHFDGHGAYRKTPFPPYRSRGYLCFEGDTGHAPDFIDGSRLGKLLAETGVRATLLNACRSAYVEAEKGPAMTSLAQDVMATGVGGVLAMGFNVSVASAARLVASVYSALAAGKALGEAVGEARRSLTDRPGVRDLEWPGILECALPVVYERTPLRLAPRKETVDLGVETSRATPMGSTVSILGAANEAWSPEKPFVGYDDAIFDLERAFRQSSIVELIGLAGAGKSALAAEFARWSAFTRPGSDAKAVVIDLADFESAGDLSEALAASPAELWVLEGADRLTWKDDLAVLLRSRASGLTLLTGRASCEFPGLTTVRIHGLDAEARRQLAALTMPDGVDKEGLSAFLDWTQGLPGLIARAKALLPHEALDSFQGTHTALQEIREGRGGTSEVWAEMGLEPYAVAEVNDVPMPVATFMFQGFLAWQDWLTFADLMAEKGVDFEVPDAANLAFRLRPAFRHGFALQVNENWFQIHPLAPALCIDPFIGVVRSMGGPDSDRQRYAVRLVSASVLQALAVGIQMANTVPENVHGFASLRRQRQNLWHVAEWGIKGAELAALALPLLPILRDELLAEGRNEEWSDVLARAVSSINANPPSESAGLVDVAGRLNRLVQQEASRHGDETTARKLRELALPPPKLGTVTIQPLGDASDRPAMDLSRNARISALRDEGRARMRSGLATCLEPLMEARELAQDDPLRRSRVELEIARAFLNVPDLRSLERYEEYARNAVHSAVSIDPSQIVAAKHSLGNAIAQRLLEEDRPEDFEARVREANLLLSFAIQSGDASLYLRASATNSLGNLRLAEGKSRDATDLMLKSSSMFEENDSSNEATMVLANAARAFALADDWEAARSFASLALSRGNAPSSSVELLQQITADTR